MSLLAALGDPRAIQPVVDALAVDDADFVHHEIMERAEELGSPLVEPLLNALADEADEDRRALLLWTLASAHQREERVLQLLLNGLAARSVGAVGRLGEHGDPRALPSLLELFDQVVREPIRDRTANEILLDIDGAVRELGGELGEHREAVVDALEQADVGEFQRDWRPRGHGRELHCVGCGDPLLPLPPREAVSAEEVEARVRALLVALEIDVSDREMRSILVCGEDALQPLCKLAEDPALAGDEAPNDGYALVRVATVLERIGDIRAVRPLLVAMRQSDALRNELGQILHSFGAAIVEPALEELSHPQDRNHSKELLVLLRSVGARSDLILQALLDELKVDAAEAARLLANYGDVRAVTHLMKEMNTLLDADVPGPESASILSDVVCAVLSLGGTLTDEQDERVTRILDREDNEGDQGEEDEEPLHDPWHPSVNSVPRQAIGEDFVAPSVAPRPPVQRAAQKIGRNEPCWCGSGRKYKKCHNGQAPPART